MYLDIKEFDLCYELLTKTLPLCILIAVHERMHVTLCQHALLFLKIPEFEKKTILILNFFSSLY